MMMVLLTELGQDTQSVLLFSSGHESYSPFVFESWNNRAVIVLLHVAAPGTASLEECTLKRNHAGQ